LNRTVLEENDLFRSNFKDFPPQALGLVRDSSAAVPAMVKGNFTSVVLLHIAPTM